MKSVRGTLGGARSKAIQDEGIPISSVLHLFPYALFEVRPNGDQKDGSLSRRFDKASEKSAVEFELSAYMDRVSVR
jgi:hypothetical protein